MAIESQRSAALRSFQSSGANGEDIRRRTFLVWLYFLHGHSPEAEQKVRRSNPRLLLSPLAERELINALEWRVFRGEASGVEIRAARKDLEKDIRDRLYAAAPMSADAYERARRISTKHSAALGTRALDILHVACAVVLRADRFWTIDARQAESARAEGLRAR